jgi:hypothetical protein
MRLLLSFVLCLIFCTAASADDVLLDIELPLTAKTAHAATKTLERLPTETTTVFIQLNVRTDEELFGRGSAFGPCYDFASLLTSEKFSHIETEMPQFGNLLENLLNNRTI